MPTASIAADLQLYGPETQGAQQLSLAQSQHYCRRLARRHYENFTVTHWLLPGHLRQHFCNVYAYCRWADDLADETADPQQSLSLLQWWEQQLQDCYQGQVSHPVFVALAETIREFEIPLDPFADLLVAFRQDQQVTRYETLDDLLNYCRYSANPVGRLVLYLGRCFDLERAKLSDSICTGLQLANFYQDVARDLDRGRIYIPLAVCRHFQVEESQFHARKYNDAFRRLMTSGVEQSERWLRSGLPLVRLVPEPLQLSIALFVQGGLGILAAIRKQNFDVWSYRPTLSRWDKLRLFTSCWWKLHRGTLVEESGQWSVDSGQ